MVVRFLKSINFKSVFSFGAIYLYFFYSCRSENNDFKLTSERSIKIEDFSKDQTLGFKSLFIKPVVSSHMEGYIDGELKLEFTCLNNERCISKEILLVGKIDTTIYMSNFYDKTYLIHFLSSPVKKGSLELLVNF